MGHLEFRAPVSKIDISDIVIVEQDLVIAIDLIH